MPPRSFHERSIGIAIATTLAVAACATEAVKIRTDVLRSRTVLGRGVSPTVRAAYKTDEGGGVLVIQSQEVCESRVEDLLRRTRIRGRWAEGTTTAWVPRAASATPVDCNFKPVSDAEVTLSTPTARVSLGKTTWKGRLTFTWSSLAPVLEASGARAMAAIEVAGVGVVGQLDLAAGKAAGTMPETAEPKPPAELAVSLPPVDDAVPFTSGDAWSEAEARLGKLGSNLERKHLPGIEIVSAPVNVQTPFGRAVAVQLESRDERSVSRVWIRFDDTGLRCPQFIDNVRRMVASSSPWKTSASKTMGTQIETTEAGERRVHAECGKNGVHLFLEDAWTQLPVELTPGKGNRTLAGDVVWQVVTRSISASQATGAEVTTADVTQGQRWIREVLEGASKGPAARALSPACRLRFDDYRRVTDSEPWVRAQFMLGLQML